MHLKDKIKNIVILGAAESGVGAALLAQAKGYIVFVSDKGKIKDAYKKELEEANIQYEEGFHTEERIFEADLIIKSPGLADKLPLIKQIKEKQIIIVSEIEFASWFTNATIISITGTNGKSTTTTLIHYFLSKEGYKVGLAGNIGKSFAKSVLEDNYDYFVLEISSFQLDDIIYFNSHISILLNITPDHLDRYNYKIENYVDSKFNITKNQTDKDFFIYDADDEILNQYLPKYNIKAKKVPYTLKGVITYGAFIQDNNLHIAINKQENNTVMSLDETTLMGNHNKSNTMASSLAAHLVNVRKKTIQECLETFETLDHRLKFVATVDKIDYINDSKATNVNSVWYALECMEKPTILIMGGVNKGNDYSALKPLISEKVRLIIALGVDNQHIIDGLSDVVPQIIQTQSMQDAVVTAHQKALPGDCVLLAPACSSFDLFDDYQDRGNKFVEAVQNLFKMDSAKLKK